MASQPVAKPTLVYIISSHGKAVFGDDKTKTTVPKNTTVLFYQSFGQPMSNDDGLKIQSALTADPQAKTPSKTAWFGNSEGYEAKPEIQLTGDYTVFKSGIVLANDKSIVYKLDKNQLVSLTWALSTIRAHADKTAPGSQVQVHCLFCLGT